jgi:hypothetical protein
MGGPEMREIDVRVKNARSSACTDLEAARDIAGIAPDMCVVGVTNG